MHSLAQWHNIQDQALIPSGDTLASGMLISLWKKMEKFGIKWKNITIFAVNRPKDRAVLTAATAKAYSKKRT